MAANFDLANMALKAVCPNNELLYDDLGIPSVMVKVPKMTYAQLGLGESTATFPAFLVNGSEVSEIYISKYQNIVQNGRAYSLPGVDPKTSITFDAALAACTQKGAGWHLMTTVEWAALILWCEKNGIIPLGNNNNGKHVSEGVYKAIPANYDSTTGNILRCLTGTGPLTWYHDQTPSGVADLCGNVWEWAGGVRSVYGELQILVNNNAADSDHPQTSTSTLWMAINASTGEFVTPNGSGTTSGTVKMDWVSSKLTYATVLTDSAPGSHDCTFGNITKGTAISDAAWTLLQAIGFAPKDADCLCKSHKVYFNNGEAERLFSRGGNCSNTTGGLASFHGNSARSTSYGNLGFRSAFVKLPAA